MLLGRVRANARALATRRGSRSFPHARHETVSGPHKVWWSPAPPGGPSPAPSPAGCLDSTPAAWPSLPYPSLGRVPNSSQLLVLSFPTPFFLTFPFSFGLLFPAFPFPTLSCPSLASLFTRTLSLTLFFFANLSLLSYPPIASVFIVSPPYTLRILCLSASSLWSLPFIRCPFPFRVLI